MFKKGPLSKAECFYIEHNHSKMNITQLSSDLNRPIVVLEKWIMKNITNAPSPIKAGDHFARTKGAVVMTENASTLSDSKRKKPAQRTPCITKIKND